MADLWQGIKKVLAGIAPVLGNAIVPGIGGIAGTLVAGVLGVDANDPAKIESALKDATPEQLIAIKDLELKHEERLLAIGLESDRLYINDRINARQREVEIVRATGKKDLNLYILAWAVVGGFFLLCGGLMYIAIPTGQNAVVLMLFGGLQAGFANVLGYFFGSSKSSSDKTALLAQAQPIPAVEVK